MKTKTKRPKKMTTAQKRKVWKEITSEAEIAISFASIQSFDIDEDGDIRLAGGPSTCLPHTMLGQIVSGTPVTFYADEEHSPDDFLLWIDGGEFYLPPDSDCIHAIEITQHGTKRTRIELGSIDEEMVLVADSDAIDIGCRRLSKKDAEAAAIAIFEWLDYEVS